jgi:hypothetical protein
MDTTTLIYAGIGALLVAALVNKPQGLVLALALSFLAAIGAKEIAHGDHIRPVLMALDSFVVVAAWYLWGIHQSTRASLVAWLGLCKIMFAIAASFSTPYLAWASVNNALFVMMILVAGDFVDGIIAWLGRRLAGVGARRAGVFRYLAHYE